MAQQGFGPPSLPVGTEVSAKYRGAFCEARVKSVVRIVKCKVVMKDCQTSVLVTDDEIKGALKLSSVVEVRHPGTGQPVEGTINKLVDQSTYTVVFDDGDERTLRRTQLCLKGDKHFIESETLDNLPLSHPEHFGTPVLQNKKARRRNEDDSEEEDDDEEDEDSEIESPRRATYRGRHQELVGKLMLVDVPNRKGMLMPALVVLPDANSLNEVKGRDQILLRSFKDSKFVIVNRKDLKEFTRSVAIKNEDKTLRIAFEKALLYFDTKELPVGWNKSDMLGSDVEEDDDDNEEDEYASDDEPFEEKDRFVAQLYKFMDERGTPINKGPCIGNKDLNLYKLFKIVQHLGGYNKVTKEMKWPVVYSKMGLPSLHQNPAHQIRTAYKKYLDAYEKFFRKLGSTMGTLSRPGRARQNSGRSIINFRAREKSPRSPKPPEKSKDDAVENLKTRVDSPATDKAEDPVDSSSVTSAEETEVLPRRTPKREIRPPSTLDETSKDKKDESLLRKKDDPPVPKVKKDDVKKDEPASGVKGKRAEVKVIKKEEDVVSAKKEERKSVRKAKTEDDGKGDGEKEEKKPIRVLKKEKDEEKDEVATPAEQVAPKADSPKKRITRRKLLSSESPKEPTSKVEEEVKEPKKRLQPKEQKPSEKKEKEKEIPKTLERRDSRVSTDKKEIEKKEVPPKPVEKKETSAEKKVKPMEEKKKKEKKTKEEGDGSDDSSEKEFDADKDPRITFPVGSKLRVKYGKGKNQKIYVAKVVDHGMVAGNKTFRVHYAGWNTRYDEWIRGDRVVSVLDRPDPNKPAPLKVTTFPKQGMQTPTTARAASPGLPAKKVTPPRASVKQPEIFRTPKLMSTKTRATRSSSTENLSDSKTSGIRKRMTRRGSTVTDSSGSKSPESQLSSDAEENVDSVEDDESTKDEKEETEDIIEIEEETKPEKELSVDIFEKPGPSSEAEEESLAKGSSMLEGTEASVEDDKVEDSGDSIEKIAIASEKSLVTDESSAEAEVAVQHEVDMKGEEHKMENRPKTAAVSKHGRLSVAVIEVNQAVDEIISSVAQIEDEEEDKKCDERDVQQVIKDLSKDIACAQNLCTVVDTVSQESGNVADVKSEPEDSAEKNQESVSSIEEVKSAHVPQAQSLQPRENESQNVLSQSIPLLKREDLELTVKMDDQNSSKSVRGRKREFSAKDSGKKSIRTLDMSGTNMASSSSPSSSSTEIPMLEPMGPAVEAKEEPADVAAPVQRELSPYDFEDDVESSWKPEITKKWEPSVSPSDTPSLSSTIASVSVTVTTTTSIDKPPKSVSSDVDRNEEKDKKKVKKKGKKKPISPEFIVEAKVEDPCITSTENQLQSNLSIKSITEVPTSEEVEVLGKEPVVERGKLRKKGRKKKNVDTSSTSNDGAVEQIETKAGDSGAADKPTHQEADSDQDVAPPVKRRRLKRVSESDSKDVIRPAKSIRKLGARSAAKLIEAGCESKSISDGAQSPLVTPEANSALISRVQEEDTEASSSRKKPDILESQGFEPEQEPQEGTAGGTFDNTPPTTPEHDEGSDNNQKVEDDDVGMHSYHHDPASQKEASSKTLCPSSSTTSTLTLSASSTNTMVVGHGKSSSESPSDNDVISTASTDNLDSGPATNQQSEGSGTDQELHESTPSAQSGGAGKKRREPSPSPAQAKKKKRVHGTRSRTARKSPKYAPNSDSQGSASNTPNHYPPESPPNKFVDQSKSPRPSKYNFNADLGEYLEGEARCNFLIAKMKEIKTIYMNLKSEVASIDRRRKRAKRKEKDGAQAPGEKETPA